MLTLKATSKEIYEYISAYLANSIRHFPKRVDTIFNESVVKEFCWNHDDYASLFNILAYLKVKNIFTKPNFIANARKSQKA